MRERILPLIALIFLLFSACQSTTPSADTPTPFSVLTWESTYQDMTELEGEPEESYPSVYYGETYTYPKAYASLEGTIKYMFDDQQRLMCIAWSSASETVEALVALYEQLHAETTAAHGESGYDPQGVNNYGAVWYLDTGNIILSVMTADNQRVLQYSFVNPENQKE